MFKHNSRDTCRNEINPFAATRWLKHARLTWSAEHCQCLPPVTLLQRNGLYFILPINRDVPHWRWLEIPKEDDCWKSCGCWGVDFLAAHAAVFFCEISDWTLQRCWLYPVAPGRVGLGQNIQPWHFVPGRPDTTSVQILYDLSGSRQIQNTQALQIAFTEQCLFTFWERSTRQITSTTRPKHDIIS